MIKIVNIYDNVKCNSKFKPDWGFSCFIDYSGLRIVFDTGANPKILEENLKTVGIDVNSIDIVVISHRHWDHKGSVEYLIDQNHNIKLYAPRDYLLRFSKKAKSVIRIDKNTAINKNIYLIISRKLLIVELALAIKTDKGLLVITGCSHTGTENIYKKTNNYLKKNIHLLYGGFHLLRASNKKTNSLLASLKELKIEKIASSHCTGNKAFVILLKEFGNNYLNSGCGSEIVI